MITWKDNGHESYKTYDKVDFSEDPLSMPTRLTLCDFHRCSFRGMDLGLHDFLYCKFTACVFSHAKLEATGFRNNLTKDCIFTGTCFDPANIPNRPKGLSGVGFRTKQCVYLDSPDYEVGRIYEAPVFSTADTQCHPGLYFYPTLEECVFNQHPLSMIEVHYSPDDVHFVGRKYRTKKFTVVRECTAAEMENARLTNLRTGLSYD